jgi:RNA polymerase sigma-70 factor (ECF subfamily)
LKLKSEHATAGTHKPEEDPVVASAVADSDDDYAGRAQKGDRAAMEILVERHHAAVARLLWRFVRTKSDLDDLVQDTFLRMVRGLPNWRGEQPFSHWLLRIATNTGRDYFRRQVVRRRWMVEPSASADELSSPEAVDPAGDPAARNAANEVKTLLGQLPPDERALLTLHHLEGWSLAHIATQYGWTLTATKLRAWRARRHLRALYQVDDSP